MPTPAPSLSRQILRRRPVSGAPVAVGASDHLQRSLGTFLLTMFGVGETVGAGIFIVLSESVPQAGPAVVISFLIAGIAAGLAAVCYAEMASAVPVSGSAYSYCYATLGELPAMGVAACLLLEYGVSTAAVAVGWSQYLNKLLDNVVGFQLPQAISAGPWDSEPGVINLPAIVLVAMCAVLLIRGASQSAKANAVMVVIKLTVLLIFAAIAFTAFNADRFNDLAPFGVSGISLAAGTIFFAYIGLDAISTAGDEVKDPQHTMPRAIIYALLIVTAIHLLVAVAAMGSQPWQEFKGEEAVLAVILDHITGNTAGSTLVSAGAVISIFSVTLVTLYGQTRILFTMGRDGLLPSDVREGQPPHDDTGREHRDRCGRGGSPGRPGAARPSGRNGLDRHPDRVHRGVRGSDSPADSTTGFTPGFQGAGLSGDTNPVDRGVRLHPVQPALVHLDCIQRLGGGGADLLPGVGPSSQRTQRRRERHGNDRARLRRRHLAKPSRSKPRHRRAGIAGIRSTSWKLYFGAATPVSVGIPRRRSRRARSVRQAPAPHCPLRPRASCRRAAATKTVSSAREAPRP